MLHALHNWWGSRLGSTKIEDQVRWVAVTIGDRETFQKRARLVANELGPSSIASLETLYHSEHTPPTEALKAQFPGLGQWLSARQFAIFEIFYFLGANSLPALRRVAFGSYDWTQGNAIEILCRLAADGIDHQQIIQELLVQIPNMREEALLYAVGPLLEHSLNKPAITEVLNELCAVKKFSDACISLSEHET